MRLFYILFFSLLSFALQAQPNNGRLDHLYEFTTKFTVPFTMPDGIKLMTDVYIPIVQDSLSVDISDTIPIFGNIVVNGTIQLIKKGTQIVIYDSLNGQPNPDPYQLPLIFTRTPYEKFGSETEGSLISLLGFAYAVQDMRGRYSSQGTYFPMLSDSWNKFPYHPGFDHNVDITSLNSKYNSNRHEDGYNSVKFITDSLRLPFGNPAITGILCNGSIGGFGASALGNTQYQYATAHRIIPNGPGLKALLPIVATNEHYKSTGFQNGVFRERIVTGWVRGQLFDLDDTQIAVDNDVQNSIHTSKDYNLPNKFQVAFKAIDHFSSQDYSGSLPGYYPNSKQRAEMDASRAKVDANGESVSMAKVQNGIAVDVPDSDTSGIKGFGTAPRANLINSRYTNSQVSAYHLTGWWDIFTDGQIETFKNMRQYCSDSLKRMQKIIIGPWAHQTIATVSTGDMTYPDNVLDITKIDVETVDPDNLPLNSILESELVEWFRYTLNYNTWKKTGDPKFIIPESQDWQDLGSVRVRVPSENYIFPFKDLLNFLNGSGGLNNIKIDLIFLDTINDVEFDIPARGSPMIAGLDTQPVNGVFPPDFSKETEVAPVRFYVVGPNDSLYGNENKGNYWFSSSGFPINNVTNKQLFLHNDGSLDFSIPVTDEGYAVYIDDPDDPVKTVGGGNMIVKNPNGDGRNSQGQMNLADPTLAPYTMNRPGVIQFTSDPITAVNGFAGDSLCIIGFPKVDFWAKSNPAGANRGFTDTDFFVRILDVYPPDANGVVKEYFVVEGAINARARNYALSIYNENEDDNAAFSNINIGWLERYRFKMMPIAYTFGKNHKIKVLISSSNHPRYQANPNIPIEDGEFFRRQPLDGNTYVYNGQIMYPRKAVQRISISNTKPALINLPVYAGISTSTEFKKEEVGSLTDMLLFTNPANDKMDIYFYRYSEYEISISNISGLHLLKTTITSDQAEVDLTDYPAGMYFIKVHDLNSGQKKLQKFAVLK